jgi:hypothetical protein
MSKIATIPYLTGFDVKPLSTSAIGVVTFTDGTNDIIPNQLQCEAYGYTYNQADGTCSIFRFNTNLDRSFSNISNKLQGAGNTTETGTNNTYIIGENNTVKGLSRNNIVVGNQNEIANGVNNANVFGTLGEATADNSIVLGGNASADSLGERQSITLLFGTETTDNTVSDSFLNNTSASYFAIPENTIIAFQSETVAVRIGGTGAGNNGDFKAFIETGVAINEAGTLSIDKSRSTIANTGTTSGWTCDLSVSGTNLVQTVKGANNRTLMWATTIRMTQIKTGVAL